MLSKQEKSKKVSEYIQKLRMAAINILGGKCIECGFSDIRALQIDHINGGGHKDRGHSGNQGPFYRKVVKSVLDNENKYQLLCANHNWIKRFKNGEHRKVNI